MVVFGFLLPNWGGGRGLRKVLCHSVNAGSVVGMP